MGRKPVKQPGGWWENLFGAAHAATLHHEEHKEAAEKDG
jgi:hypothetical protein